MIINLRDIRWIEKSNAIDNLLTKQKEYDAVQLGQGLEGKVVKIYEEKQNKYFALKIWNEYFDPNLKVQYDVLRILSEQNLPVSFPYGFGKNKQNQSVFLTSYDGSALTNLDQERIIQLAQFLITLHKLSTNEFSGIELPIYNFQTYFFPNIELHLDLFETLQQLINKADFNHISVIHGDYHLNNIVEQHGKLTVIDWTNIQLGDIRYDFAWSYLLQRLYVSQQVAAAFYSIYLKNIEIKEEELKIFEAIACIRWILLNRHGNVPLNSETIKKINDLISRNDYLMPLACII